MNSFHKSNKFSVISIKLFRSKKGWITTNKLHKESKALTFIPQGSAAFEGCLIKNRLL